MAWKNMLVAPSYGITPNNCYECSVDLAGAGNSDWIMIPRDVRQISVTVHLAGGGTAKVQATTDDINTVKTGSPVAVDWDAGEVSADTQDVAAPCTAIRLVQVHAGTASLSLRAQ